MAEGLSLLLKTLPVAMLFVPQAVHAEIQVGLKRGRTYLQAIETAISTRQVEVIALTDDEVTQSDALPHSMGRGEREAIVLAQRLSATLLTNDKRVVNYCKDHRIGYANLNALLTLLWKEQAASQTEIRTLIKKMYDIEGITLRAVETIFKEDYDSR